MRRFAHAWMMGYTRRHARQRRPAATVAIADPPPARTHRPRVHAAEPLNAPNTTVHSLVAPHEDAPFSGYEYAIRSGDTLWDIAAAHEITVQDLLAANPGLDSAALRVGQIILVPATPPSATEPTARQEAPSAAYEYLIKTADTLWDIAVAHRITSGRFAGGKSEARLQRLARRSSHRCSSLAAPGAAPPPPPSPTPSQPEIVAPDANAAPTETAAT